MKIIPIAVGDILTMKKNHPCGSNEMKVLMVGSDIKMKCLGCGHDMMVPRIKLEKSIKNVSSQSDGQEKN